MPGAEANSLNNAQNHSSLSAYLQCDKWNHHCMKLQVAATTELLNTREGKQDEKTLTTSLMQEIVPLTPAC